MCSCAVPPISARTWSASTRPRERVPEADLRLADMEALPFGESSFDLVAGFNSFFFAVDMVAALREASRVARQRPW